MGFYASLRGLLRAVGVDGVARVSAVDPSALGRALPPLPGPEDGHLRLELLVLAAMEASDSAVACAM